MKCVAAVAYHFGLNFPATFLQPHTEKFSLLCTQMIDFSSRVSDKKLLQLLVWRVPYWDGINMVHFSFAEGDTEVYQELCMGLPVGG